MTDVVPPFLKSIEGWAMGCVVRRAWHFPARDSPLRAFATTYAKIIALAK
jgi:hypothetical protein